MSPVAIDPVGYTQSFEPTRDHGVLNAPKIGTRERTVRLARIAYVSNFQSGRERKKPRRLIKLRPEGHFGRLEEWHPTCLRNSWRGNMQSFGIRVFKHKEKTMRQAESQSGKRLRALAAVMLTLAAGGPSGFAQQAAAQQPAQPTVAVPSDKYSSDLPAEPAPTHTQPPDLRQSERDFTKPAGRLLGNPFKMY